MWEVLGIFPWKVKLDDPFLSLHFAFYRKTCLRYRIFFPWCLATEREWGWQNEDAAGSWGEQKEGKDRRLADDAGESGSKGLPWENRAHSAAECTLPAPVCYCQQWQEILWREFHVLPLSLGVLVHFHTCWCWFPPCAVTICCCCDKDLWDGSQHLTFPQEPFQFYWSTIGAKSIPLFKKKTSGN